MKENWELLFLLGCMIFKDQFEIVYEYIKSTSTSSQPPVNGHFFYIYIYTTCICQCVRLQSISERNIRLCILLGVLDRVLLLSIAFGSKYKTKKLKIDFLVWPGCFSKILQFTNWSSLFNLQLTGQCCFLCKMKAFSLSYANC